MSFVFTTPSKSGMSDLQPSKSFGATRVYDFLNFLLSWDFLKKFNFLKNLRLQNIPQRWHNVTQFDLKNLLKIKKKVFAYK